MLHPRPCRANTSMSAESPWRLVRLDDNHNEVAVARFARREEAEAAKRRFEARGHKQSWFIRFDAHACGRREEPGG